MDETDVLTLPDDMFTGNSWVGANYDGTQSIPAEAQPNNRPWDTGGAAMGDYSGALGILRSGIAAYTATQQRIIATDYRSYQATAGGLFQVGQPSGGAAAQTVAAPRLTSSGLIVLAAAAWLLLK